MTTKGSYAMRGDIELTMTMEEFCGSENILPCLHLYTNAGGERINTNFKLGKSMISFFLHLDLGRVVTGRPAASRSYRNLVEMCHCIGNLGFQLVENDVS